MSDERTEGTEGTGNEQPTELSDSTPNAGGRGRAEGGMGVSSERVGPTGGGGEGTDGEKDTTAPALGDPAGDVVGADAEFDQGTEENPEGIEPKAGYPSLDPRSEDHPYKDA
jgi:hypothetical protein